MHRLLEVKIDRMGSCVYNVNYAPKIPVSYTHLDVYKIQAVRVLANRILPYCLSNRNHYGLFIGERTEKIAVSYTHLDVYKRQPLTSRTVF